jgi:hypothetical protein
MLTISETCRLQHRPIYKWLCAAVDASLRNETAPPILTDP